MGMRSVAIDNPICTETFMNATIILDEFLLFK